MVTGPNGPEAGVWVIAETTDLPTRFAKIVVTDDQGRYVLPDLPKANYNVWVRGYGLVDSPKVATAPGKILNLTAVPAPSAAAAAEYYPAIYWYSMLKVPDKSEFPGTGPQGNGMPTNIRSQAQWLDVVKTNGCYTCHQLGNKATRTIPQDSLGKFEAGTRPGRGASSPARRSVQHGQRHRPPRHASARSKLFARLDRPHRRGRTAGREAAAPAGRRAQRRHHGVGLVRSQGLSARRRSRPTSAIPRSTPTA